MAREAGRIGVTEILVGVPFPSLAFEIVRFAVPPRYLPEFTLSGATYATDEALRRGWVDELAEPSDLMDDAMAVAKELALLSPGAFAQTKMQIRQPVVERVQKSGKVTDEAVTEIWAAPATLAYIRDYVTRTLGRILADHFVLRPCSRSAMMSSLSSRPTDSRTTSGPAPA